MARFAISDIHGCVKTFVALLDQIGYSKGDELFLLGDYIDRGPNSKGVIDFIWSLQAKGHEIIALQGNHEQMLLDQFFSKEEDNDYHRETLISFGASACVDIPIPYIEWMLHLPTHHLLDDYVLVHAGLNFRMVNPLQDRRAMLWIRYWYDDLDRKWLGKRIIIHGHTPITKDRVTAMVTLSHRFPVIDIDAGCVYHQMEGRGHLCALNLDTKALTFQKNIDEPQ